MRGVTAGDRGSADRSRISTTGLDDSGPSNGPIAAIVGGNRYVLLEPLGSGGSAIVYTAYDRKLDRKIAVKLLHDQRAGAAYFRLLREAQALARLRHPNVVTVYDVGTLDDGRVFVAMELVEGLSLRRWHAARRPGWREIVRVFVAAGRGLAAAHAQGLVHRDFKPDNVLIGDDGAVRVADFGLARLVTPGPDEHGEHVDHDCGGDAPQDPTPGASLASADTVPSSRGASALSSEVTAAGTVVGTPRYMPPEQTAGRRTDARSDQFAFCVSLYEALYDQDPFDAPDLAGRQALAAAGKLAPRPPRSPVPPRLHALLARGLSAAPEERHPSMDRLLDELERDPAARRRRVAAAVAVVAVLGGVSAWAVLRPTSAPPDPCAGAERKLDGVWDEPRRAAVRKAFLDGGRAHGPATYERVRARLDSYAAALVAMRRDACEATAVRHEQSPALLDLRMACLDRRLHTLGTLTGLFARGFDDAVLSAATSAALRLDDLESCADAGILSAAVPPPSDRAVRGWLAGLRERLGTARALVLAGKHRVALPIATAVAAEAAAAPHAQLRAEAQALLGNLQANLRDHAAAEASYRLAIEEAARAHDDDLAASSWINLLWVVGRSRTDEALALEPAARAAVIRAGDAAKHRAGLASTVGVAYLNRGDHTKALRQFETAVALNEAAGRVDEFAAAHLSSLGLALRHDGQHEAARSAHLRSILMIEQLLGPEHPHIAGQLMNLGNLLALAGRHAEARTHQERALAIFEGAQGPDGADVALALNNLGELAILEGRIEEARRLLERALVIKEQRLGPEDRVVSSTLIGLARVHVLQRQLPEARRLAERALAIRTRVRGAEHPDVAEALASVAGVALAERNLAAAQALLDRAVAIHEKNPARRNHGLADALELRADVLTALGKRERAAADRARVAGHRAP